MYTVLEILSICQLHILRRRTAQISLEVHFCVELHTKESPGGIYTDIPPSLRPWWKVFTYWKFVFQKIVQGWHILCTKRIDVSEAVG